MRLVEFDRAQAIPVVEVWVRGPRSAQRVKLVFDTGSALSQLDTGLIEDIGYSIRDSSGLMSVQGAAGDAQEGYMIKVQSLILFGRTFQEHSVGVYDFDNFTRYGIDGLLGFDVIKQLHLEMNGPGGILKIF